MKQKTPVCDCEVIHEEVVGRVRKTMPREEMCVCDIAVLLNMTKSAISHQLRALRLANLVKYDRRGKEVYYSLADSHVKDIFEKGFEHIHE